MLGCYYPSSMRPYPNIQFPISQGQRIYPGPSHSGYFSLSNSHHLAQQPNIAATVAKAHLDETDIYMSRYELSVKMYLADRYKSSVGHPQSSKYTAGQEHRSLLDEENDRSRQLRLVVSSVVGSADLDDRTVTEETLTEKVYNQMPGKMQYLDRSSRMPPKVEYVRSIIQMPAKFEYVDRRDQIFAKTHKPNNLNHISIQHGHSSGLKQTHWNSIGISHSKPSLRDQGLFPHAQHQLTSSGEKNPEVFVSKASLGCKDHGDRKNTRRTGRSHGQTVQLEHTPLANPMMKAGSSTSLPRRKNTANRNGWSLSALLSAPFSSNTPSSSGWTSSDLLAASFASTSFLSASSSRPSPNSISFNSSETSKSSNPINSKPSGHEMIEIGPGGLSTGAISSYLLQNPIPARYDQCLWGMEKNGLFENDPSEPSLYDTADESPPKSVDLQRNVDLESSDGEENSRFTHFQSSQGSGSAASQHHLDSSQDYYAANSWSNVPKVITHDTDLADEPCYRDLFLLEGDTTSPMARIENAELGTCETEIHDGKDTGANLQNISTPSHSNTFSPVGKTMGNKIPQISLSTSDTIREYLNSCPQPVTPTKTARRDISFTPAPLYAPTPLSITGESLVERLERLAMDWVEPIIIEEAESNMGDKNFGVRTTNKSSSRAPIPPETVKWLRQNLEDIANEWVPASEDLYPEDIYYYY